ncbi:MAG: hypothetical protein ACYC27_12170 [Armatimonadota bacterium]
MSSQFTMIVFIGLVIVSVTQVVSAKSLDNLITNPGFEQKLEGWSAREQPSQSMLMAS